MSEPYRAPEADSETDESAADAELARGRLLLLTVLVIALVDVPFGLVLAPRSAAAYKAIPLLTASYYAYHGRNWAKLALLLWFPLVAGFSLWLLTHHVFTSRLVAAYVTAMAVSHLAGLAVLLGSTAVARFMRQQRLARFERKRIAAGDDDDEADEP